MSKNKIKWFVRAKDMGPAYGTEHCLSCDILDIEVAAYCTWHERYGTTKVTIKARTNRLQISFYHEYYNHSFNITDVESAQKFILGVVKQQIEIASEEMQRIQRISVDYLG